MKKSVLIIAAFSLAGCAGFPGASQSTSGAGAISSELLEKTRAQNAASHSGELERRYSALLETVNLDFGERRATHAEQIEAMRRALDEQSRVEAESLANEEALAREVALFGHCQGLLLDIEQMQDDLAEKEGYIIGRQESGTSVFFGQSLADAAAEFAAIVGQYDASAQQFQQLNCGNFPNFAGVEFPAYQTPGQ